MITGYGPLLWGFVVWLGLVLWYWQEAIRHRKNRDSIPLRIHINGTRGKSGVTRLIAAGLRAGGVRTVAKTTGSAAMLIEPDGSEFPLKRRGPANIREIIFCTAHAAKADAEAFVAECMALQPELQWFAEHCLLHSHIGVITNIRADHEDVMGQGLPAVAAALANTIPPGGILVTGAKELDLLTATGCLPPGVTVHLADAAKLPAAAATGFSYPVFVDNIALALTVCELAGVDRETALTGMRQAPADCGHLTLSAVDIPGATITVVNALAANDPDSTSLLFKRFVQPEKGSAVVWLHGRPDRKLRSVQLCQVLAGLHDGLFILSGDTAFLKSQLGRCQIDSSRLIEYTGDSSLRSLLAILPQPVTLFAAGNIHGLTSELIPLPQAH